MAPEFDGAALDRSPRFAGTEVAALTAHWTVANRAAGAVKHPSGLADSLGDGAWLPISVPGTAAAALRTAGQWDWEHPRDFDAEDWWFRCHFATPEFQDGRTRWLRFDGLATLAEVWLNGDLVLASDSMWLAHRVEVTGRLREQNELVIRCASLTAALGVRRPRPRWRTRVVEQQQLRWFRTTLLGRMPGWTPPVAPVGPWRGVYLETHSSAVLRDIALRPTLSGDDGVLSISAKLLLAGKTDVATATLRVGKHESQVNIAVANGSATVSGSVTIPRVERWWPHTHGAPAMHTATLVLHVGGAHREIALGRIGFRDLAVDRGADGKGFSLRINGAPVFARGACWAPLDIATLSADPDAYRAALAQVCAAGFNMLRVSGTMAYETDAFYDACDAAGVLIWHDFMFANMDYPVADPKFAELVRAEAAQLLARLAHRPALAVLCGGSEIEQQAAMLGLAPESWRGPLYDHILPEECAALAPSVPYVSNSPSGGPLPFLSNEGIAHYYGVGAYLRPLEDARRAAVRFTTECLGFANVPEPRTVELVSVPTEPAPHHPRWKARVPRDRGAGWDFEDVRDHYFSLIFGRDPMQTRYADVERYLALSRVVTGEVMSRTIAEWRRPDSGCRGALVWMHRDLWPGAGWGVIDSTGVPKAAYWFMARASAPVTVLATDEGVNGVAFHVVNDAATALDAEIAVTLWRGPIAVAQGASPVSAAARSATTLSADALLGRFTDVAYAYRFGPPGHDLVTATLRDRATGSQLAEAFHFPGFMPAEMREDLGLTAEAWPGQDGQWKLKVTTERLALAIALDVPGAIASDSYFHLTPGSTKLISLRTDGAALRLSGAVRPLNADQPTQITVRETAP